MWLFDAVATGFRTPTDEARLQLFRMLVGTAAMLKLLAFVAHGGWSQLEPGSYMAYVVRRRYGTRRAAWICAVHKPVLVLGALGSTFLAAGALPKAAAVMTVAALTHELSYRRRSNNIYLALVISCLLFAGALAHGPVPVHRRSPGNTWAQFLIVVITIDMYWNTAWLKSKSPHFYSGLLLAQWIDAGGRLRERLPHWEYWYPQPLLRQLSTSTPSGVSRWRVLSRATIVLEVLLPVGLLTPSTRPYAALVGLGMHLCFLLLMPLQLVGFSLATVASYVLFAP